ncbi:DUF981 domain-containing protein [Arthrobacter echini]|uniref:DUF981 domain-containing protein n=1 Tax=Arthrobacter echini TaxID=1529066 RepID=A0A4S5E455_9MICC|nr:DUF981 domain-containing protein [Arthrobacter echini]THJ66180.1 DUF981 domain-containing protein [Arthrobacter echini]
MDDFFTGGDSGLVIDWTQMPTYNTIMSVAAGAGLIFVVMIGRALTRSERFKPEGWALTAGVLGFLLTVTGLHMTLTWPFARYFPFDNIVFGETSLAFGVLLLATALYLWKRGDQITEAEDRAAEAASVAGPLGVFVVGLGLALFGIAAAGLIFQLFAAPPEEPVAGSFAGSPMIEAVFISGLFALIGLGAVLFPFALRTFSSLGRLTPLVRTVGILWLVAGIVFLLFGAMNFYTHIGLIVNTMPEA